MTAGKRKRARRRPRPEGFEAAEAAAEQQQQEELESAPADGASLLVFAGSIDDIMAMESVTAPQRARLRDLATTCMSLMVAADKIGQASLRARTVFFATFAARDYDLKRGGSMWDPVDFGAVSECMEELVSACALVSDRVEPYADKLVSELSVALDRMREIVRDVPDATPVEGD